MLRRDAWINTESSSLLCVCVFVCVCLSEREFWMQSTVQHRLKSLQSNSRDTAEESGEEQQRSAAQLPPFG